MIKWKKKDSCTSLKEVIERNTGMSEADFLRDDYQTPIKNMDEMIAELNEIAADGRSVGVFADYDCDGICSAVIMHIILQLLKVKSFKVYFPKRSTGYGLKPFNVDNIDKDVIITVDNGIAANDAISYANSLGKEVLVIDHHLAAENLPEAKLIIDPHVFKFNENDFEDWCGAGLCYELGRRLFPKYENLMREIAALATVADVVPLVKDNRQIVKIGLNLLLKSSIMYASSDKPLKKGDEALTRLLIVLNNGYAPKYIDENTVGFKIAPIFNAMSRVEDDAEYVYKYILKNDTGMLRHMLDINEKRKCIVNESVEKAYKQIAEECLFADFPLVLYEPSIPEGVVGIVAGRLAEEKNIPVIVLTDSSEEGVIKGSARNPLEDLNIKEELEKVSELLESFGGHKGAAGLSLKAENLPLLRTQFSKMYADREETEPEMVYDLELSPEQIVTANNELRKYAPFGAGNENPVFLINKFRLLPNGGKLYDTIGDGRTIKLYAGEVSAIGFEMLDKYQDIGLPKNLNLLGKINENHFGKTVSVQIEMIDIEKSKEEVKEKSNLANALKKGLLASFGGGMK